jgi:uncharacterized membrane protein YdbT with pleckstrin-like domain
MNKQYPSAVDWWLAASLISVPVCFIAFGGFLFSRNIPVGLLTVAWGVGVGWLIAAMSLPCRYTLSDSGLRIECGILKEEVPYNRIRGAELSRSLLSAPALSVQRVRVLLDSGSRLISPKDREQFIQDLRSRLGAHKQHV